MREFAIYQVGTAEWLESCQTVPHRRVHQYTSLEQQIEIMEEGRFETKCLFRGTFWRRVAAVGISGSNS